MRTFYVYVSDILMETCVGRIVVEHLKKLLVQLIFKNEN